MLLRKAGERPRDSDWNEIGYWKGEVNGKGERGQERKKALPKSSFGGKSCTILGYVWIPNSKALRKEPVLVYWVLLVGPGGIRLGFARLGDAS